MVTRQEYMSVVLSKCGNDPATFREVSNIWNRQKEKLRGMSKSELEERFTCP